MVSTGTMPTTSTQFTKHENDQPVAVNVVTEAKLQEVTKSNIYHDDTFLKFLKVSKDQVNGHRLKYVRSLHDQMSYIIVVPRMVNNVCFKKIIMVTKNKLWHLSYDTLKDLKYSEVNTLLKLIEKKGDNNMCPFEDLKNDQPSRLTEVSTYPRTIIFQSGTRIEDVSQLAIPSNLTHNNRSFIYAVIDQLKKKKG